jgi:catechol 2,3-dioxygenase
MAPTARIGAVHLTVRDLEGSQRFYERVLGMRAVQREDGSVSLGAVDGSELLVLHGGPGAAPRDPHRAGLFHFAVLVPSRVALGTALMRLVGSGWPLDGASDHLVSEALYLTDPEGNGIEIYRDRPREEWPRASDGTLEMATLPLDLNAIAAEADRASVGAGLPAGTTIGHIHLQVSELQEIEKFYAEALGFDVVVRGYPGALFVSAGGYHHHVGLNTWHSRGGAAAELGAAGLGWYEICVGSEDGLADCLARVQAAGVVTESVEDGVLVRDPSGNGVLLRA